MHCRWLTRPRPDLVIKRARFGEETATARQVEEQYFPRLVEAVVVFLGTFAEQRRSGNFGSGEKTFPEADPVALDQRERGEPDDRRDDRRQRDFCPYSRPLRRAPPAGNIVRPL